MGFFDGLRDHIKATDSVVSVGLDVDIGRLPDHLLDRDLPRWTFSHHVIDVTYEHAAALKSSAAFCGDEDGWHSLRETTVYTHGKGMPVLLDAKRVDVGNTAHKYTDLPNDADVITVSPYMGRDFIQPLLSREDKGAFIPRRASDSGGTDLQSFELGVGEPLYERVAVFCNL